GQPLAVAAVVSAAPAALIAALASAVRTGAIHPRLAFIYWPAWTLSVVRRLAALPAIVLPSITGHAMALAAIAWGTIARCAIAWRTCVAWPAIAWRGAARPGKVRWHVAVRAIDVRRCAHR